MKNTEQGILLSKSDYSETSLVVRILTEHHGLQSFLFQGAKKKKGTVVLPLLPIEFTNYKRSDSSMGKITEWNTLFPVANNSIDPVKSCICFFVAETVQQLVHQDQPDEALFRFLLQEIHWMNESVELSNYPIWFLAECAKLSGIVPDPLDDDGRLPSVFDFKRGCFTNVEPMHPFYHKHHGVHWCEDAVTQEKNHFLALAIPKAERTLALEAWLGYFSFQIAGFRKLKSVEVIQTILNS